MPLTLYDKIWDSHVIGERSDGLSLLYVDRHLLHEVTSPQAFDGLRSADRKPWRLNANIATPDHAIPTVGRELGLDGIEDPIAREQVETLQANCRNHDIELLDLLDDRQGIVHVIGPEQGATLPGSTIVCGDSHTSTHGAFGALAHGIGTSEVEHVLATQCLAQNKSANMSIEFTGSPAASVTAKDLILACIRQIGLAGATGHTIEYRGEAIKELSMEGRMTLCNMSIEAGARAGMVAPDDTTFAYIEGKPKAPTGKLWEAALDAWRNLQSDSDATFDSVVEIDVTNLAPQVTWGTNPELGISVDELIPDPTSFATQAEQEVAQRALDYMGVEAGRSLSEYPLDMVFIGSCTNARIEDIRAAAQLARNRRVADNVQAIVVPGSGLVKKQSESEGLHEELLAAGFEWRAPGCSMCLAMNNDKVPAEKRCASTSNRNFEGRQGHLSRTHLVSPVTAAASAIAGYIIDPREYV